MHDTRTHHWHLLAFAADVKVGAEALVHDVVVAESAPEQYARFTVLRCKVLLEPCLPCAGGMRLTEYPLACDW